MVLLDSNGNFLPAQFFYTFDQNLNYVVTPADVVSQVPLPAGAVLILTGMGALAAVRRRKS